MDRKLPVYRLELSDDAGTQGVSFISMVAQPAIMVKAIKFNSQFKFSVNPDRQIITTPVLIPDLPVYRRDKERGEYYVVIEKDQVEKTQHKFMKSGSLHNVNEMHDDNKVLDGVYMINSFLTDVQMGIQAPEAFSDLPEGTWFVSYHIENPIVWAKFKETEELNGISIEAIFNMVSDEELQEKKNHKTNQANTKMSKTEEVKGLMTLCEEYLAKSTKTEVKFSDAKLQDGTIVRFPADKIVKGDMAEVVTVEGVLPLPDSAPDVPYTLEDGTTFTVVNGMVDEIVEAVEEETKDAKPGDAAPSTEPVKTEQSTETKAPKRVIKSTVEEHVFSIELENEVIQLDFSSMFKGYELKLSEMATINLKLSEAIEELSDEPATGSVTKHKPVPVKRTYNDLTNYEKVKYNRGELEL